jgi:hypothetical protein
VQVLSSLAPAADVHTRDAARGEDRALDAAEHDALLPDEFLRQIGRPGMTAHFAPLARLGMARFPCERRPASGAAVR